MKFYTKIRRYGARFADGFLEKKQWRREQFESGLRGFVKVVTRCQTIKEAEGLSLLVTMKQLVEILEDFWKNILKLLAETWKISSVCQRVPSSAYWRRSWIIQNFVFARYRIHLWMNEWINFIVENYKGYEMVWWPKAYNIPNLNLAKWTRNADFCSATIFWTSLIDWFWFILKEKALCHEGFKANLHIS